MGRSRSVLLWLPALVLTCSWAQAETAAQAKAAVSVQAITVDGKSVKSVDGVRVAVPGAARPESRELKETDSLPPGTVIEVPLRTVVKLITANSTEITLQPGSRTKINAVSATGESITQVFGEVWFKVVRALSFFEVTHERFLAAVKGTEFKVAADDEEIRFEWLAGEIQVSRDVKITIAGSAQEEPVTLSETVSASNPRVGYRVSVEEYLRDFGTRSDVEEYFRRRLEEDERSGDDERIVLGLTNLGTALVTIAKPKEAISYFERSLATHLRLFPGGLHPSIAADYGRLGMAHSESGDARKAIGYFEQSLALLLRLYPDGVHPDIAVNYTNLGVANGKAGDPRRAIGYFEQSLALLPKLYSGPDGVYPGTVADPALAANLGNLGSEYGRLKEPRRAIDYFERALALHRKMYPDGVHPDIAIDYNNLGVQYMRLDDHVRAIDSYDRSLALLLQLYPDGLHPAIVQVYGNLASIWRARGDRARADDYAKKQKDAEAKLKR
jgi:tetratricopeptide (TPR) repeat protein